jgi:hypothetical protein
VRDIVVDVEKSINHSFYGRLLHDRRAPAATRQMSMIISAGDITNMLPQM